MPPATASRFAPITLPLGSLHTRSAIRFAKAAGSNFRLPELSGQLEPGGEPVRLIRFRIALSVEPPRSNSNSASALGVALTPSPKGLARVTPFGSGSNIGLIRADRFGAETNALEQSISV